MRIGILFALLAASLSAECSRRRLSASHIPRSPDPAAAGTSCF